MSTAEPNAERPPTPTPADDAVAPEAAPEADVEAVEAGLHEVARSSPRRSHGWIESLLIAFLLAMGIRHFLIQAYKIPSGSMIPTLRVGDQLLASKISYGIRLPFADEKLAKFATPARGEIVVFRFPDDPNVDFIKRAVAVPGDRIRIEDGRVVVNGQPLDREDKGDFSYRDQDGRVRMAKAYTETNGDHRYTVIYDARGYHPYWNMDERELGPDEVFVMGDNRDHSNDSRFWGPVDMDLLQGRPLFIHFSWDGRENEVRWSRFGTALN